MQLNTQWWEIVNPWYNTGNEQYNIYQTKIKGSGTRYEQAILSGVIERGEEIDRSIAYAKVDSNCPWTNYTVINKADNNSKKVVRNGSVPLVNYLVGGYNVRVNGAGYNQNFCLAVGAGGGFNVDPYKCAGWYNSKCDIIPYYQYSSTSTKYIQITPNFAGLNPVGKFGGQAYLLTIMVYCSRNATDSVVNFTLKEYCDERYQTYPYIRSVYIVPYSYNAQGQRVVISVGNVGSGDPYPGPGFAPLTNNLDLTFSLGTVNVSTWDAYLPSSFRQYQNIFGYAGGVDNAHAVMYSASNAYMSLDEKSKIVQSPSNPNDHCSATRWDEIASTIEGVREYFKRSTAYFGLFFTEDYAPTARPTFKEDTIMLGLMDEDGVTHGQYSVGSDNENQFQFNSKDIRQDSNVDPEQEDRPRPEPDRNPVLPSQPGFSLANAGSQTYVMTKEDFQQVWDDIYSRKKSDWKDLIEGLQLFGSNPLNAILSYRWFPFNLRSSSQVSGVVLGNTKVSETHTYPVIEQSNAFYTMGGSFWYGKEKNFINSKHCKCRVWLPFYGFAELPMTQVLSKELEIKFQYNAPDDIGIWVVSFGNVIYDYYECSPYIDIPITGDNSRAISIAKQSQAVNTALTIGAAVAAVGLSVAGAAGSIGAAAAASGVSAAEYASQTFANTGAFLTGGTMLYGGAEAAKQIGIVGKAVGGAVAGTVGGGITAVKGITTSANQIGTLATNVPTKAGASATTFLHLPMKPYIQFYTNEPMETMNLVQYRKTVGIACEQWGTIDSMPEDSLLVISNPTFNTNGMTQNEINALISALNGFYK